MFEGVEYPRHEVYIEHKASKMLILVMGAVICGITELADMMMYFKNKLGFYKEKFQIEKIPSKATFSQVLSVLNADAIGDVMECQQLFRQELREMNSFVRGWCFIP